MELPTFLNDNQRYEWLSDFIGDKLLGIIEFGRYVKQVKIYPCITKQYGITYGRLYFTIEPSESSKELSTDERERFFTLCKISSDRTASWGDFIAYPFDRQENELKMYKTFEDWYRISAQLLSVLLSKILLKSCIIDILDLSCNVELRFISNFWDDCDFNNKKYKEIYGMEFEEDCFSYTELKEIKPLNDGIQIDEYFQSSDLIFANENVADRYTIRKLLLDFKTPVNFNERGAPGIFFNSLTFYNQYIEAKKSKKFENQFIDRVNSVALLKIISKNRYISGKQNILNAFEKLKFDFLNNNKIVDVGDVLQDSHGDSYRIDEITLTDIINFDAKPEKPHISYQGRIQLKSGGYSARRSFVIPNGRLFDQDKLNISILVYVNEKIRLLKSLHSLQREFFDTNALAKVGYIYEQSEREKYVITDVSIYDSIENKNVTEVFDYYGNLMLKNGKYSEKITHLYKMDPGKVKIKSF